MWAAAGQYVGGRVVTAVLVLAVAGAGYWFYQHPEHLDTIWQIIKYVIAWIGFVLVLPWATIFVTTWIVSKDSNTAAVLMLSGYVLADVLVAFWMIGSVSGHNALTWVVLLLGFLSAGLYNFKVCEYQAELAENR